MVGPVFTEGAYTALVKASHDAFVPGLDSVPDDSITLLETNPEFIAAYLAGLNSALGHELLWRGYPTDERGTYWHSFWGAGQDIGDAAHVPWRAGRQRPHRLGSRSLVLVLRGRLLRRYPDTDIYAVLAGGDAGRAGAGRRQPRSCGRCSATRSRPTSRSSASRSPTTQVRAARRMRATGS